MAACEYCGQETGLPQPDTCNNCHDLLRHLPKFLTSREGRFKVSVALNEARVAKQQTERLEKIREVSEGRTIVDLEELIIQKRAMKAQMVGTLYPSIFDSEISLLNEAISWLRTSA